MVTPPTGSAVEVDVTNGFNEGVSGVTAKATFIPLESGSYNTVEGTTGTAGCVVLTGIQATSAKIEIVEKTGFVTPAGALKVQPKEISIAPNITTHYAVQYAQAGRIAAHFTYEGKEVPSDTFIASNAAMTVEPKYETGSTAFNYEKTGEEKFLPYASKALSTALPSQAPQVYGTTSWTAAGSKYPIGDLFPFKEKWTVYAGDCAANNTGAEAVGETVQVKSGETANVKVPISYTKLSIWNGKSQKEHEEPTSKRYGPVKITNTECESGGATPPNATGTVFTHEQKETLPEGRLEVPYQPFGKNFKLCVVNSEPKKTYTVSFTNTDGRRLHAEHLPRPAPERRNQLRTRDCGSDDESEGSLQRKGRVLEKGRRSQSRERKIRRMVLGLHVGQRKIRRRKKPTTRPTKANTKPKNGGRQRQKQIRNRKNEIHDDKAKYETEKANYTSYKTTYETKKAEYEAKKKAYEKNKKANEKTEYEKLATEYKEYETKYKAAKTAYEKYETEYKAAETAYKKYETEYKAEEAAYKEYEVKYKAAETAYKSFETAYKKDETEYKKYENYKELEKQATEYQYYLEYVAAKATYEKTKAEEEDATASGVTVKAGTTC